MREFARQIRGHVIVHSQSVPSRTRPVRGRRAACRAAGHGNGPCVVLCAGLHALFDGKADAVDLVWRHF